MPKIDRFTVMILSAVALAVVVPAQGLTVGVLSWATRIGIFILFFLYGARLSTAEAKKGLTHWRLHLVILAATYLVFPLIGLSLRLTTPWLISPDIYTGVLFLSIVPSTVQSSISFTSIAKGNVAGAVVAASASNLLGVALTPGLALALMSTSSSAAVNPRSFLDVAVQILVPFILGQVSRRWTATWVGERKAMLKWFDQLVIVAVVYSAFSAGMRENIWAQINWQDLVWLSIICVLVLIAMLWLTHQVALWLGFNREDRIAIQFCGTKKSLATGVPMASILFAGQPVGLIVIPLMIFHQLQLLACAWLAARYSTKFEEETSSQPHS